MFRILTIGEAAYLSTEIYLIHSQLTRLYSVLVRLRFCEASVFRQVTLAMINRQAWGVKNIAGTSTISSTLLSNLGLSTSGFVYGHNSKVRNLAASIDR